jgi:23S rRNA (guanosine2251-2'-O)-methyltransferase
MEPQYDKDIGRNAVKEALKSGRNINKIYIAKGETDHTLNVITRWRGTRNIYVQMTDRRKLTQ